MRQADMLGQTFSSNHFKTQRAGELRQWDWNLGCCSLGQTGLDCIFTWRSATLGLPSRLGRGRPGRMMYFLMLGQALGGQEHCRTLGALEDRWTGVGLIGTGWGSSGSCGQG